MNFFTEEFLDLHNDPEQLKKQDRISDVAVKTKDKMPMIDFEKKTMLTTAGKKHKQEYEVSLEHCTCKNFALHKLPCKHMYKLANLLGLYERKEERSKNLIADFSKGYADGWFFTVRPCNYLSLDIVAQQRVAEGEKRGKNPNSKKETVLTQGNVYNFIRGSLFYDSPVAYEGMWKEALKKIKFCVQIDYVTPSSAIPKIIFENNKFVRIMSPIYGVVDFSFYKPNKEKTDLEKIEKFSCRQDEFLELLKTGIFADSNGEVHNLSEGLLF